MAEPKLDSGEKIKLQLKDFHRVKNATLAGEGYLGEAKALFEVANDLDELMKLPEFIGRVVDR